LETAEPSVSLFTHSFKKKNLLIAGNEALGLDRAVLEKVDYILQIPLFGWKNSLNVGTATSIACYEIIRQVY
ncbi:MAG TPA: TrmH family RNA methyltransferase, partial [Candidatus Cloacimonadota bacterium]|nr:TrmH family RNA methyltransferase [Candidatus Cloacimonadota bacterium]